MKETSMSRIAWLSIFWLLGGVAAHAGVQDYTEPLLKLTELADSKQYTEAIEGYRRLQLQQATPAWLKAASEYEVAELYSALGQNDSAIASFLRAVQLGYDDCLTPRSSERLAAILTNPKVTQALSRIRISEGDLAELTWLKSEVEHAEHDARMMITDNINRVDQDPTEIPQSQLPTRPTTSTAVLYWRQQVLLMQRAQRDFVKRSDAERVTHAATMGVTSGAPPQAAVMESARLARSAAESRKAEIRKRAFIPVAASADQLTSCPH
jgi:tetratricopeptide (TPR) repeat protein